MWTKMMLTKLKKKSRERKNILKEKELVVKRIGQSIHKSTLYKVDTERVEKDPKVVLS